MHTLHTLHTLVGDANNDLLDLLHDHFIEGLHLGVWQPRVQEVKLYDLLDHAITKGSLDKAPRDLLLERWDGTSERRKGYTTEGIQS